VERLLDGIAPEAVLHTVAPPSVDWHERERAAAYATNVLGTRAIAAKTRKLGAKLVYVSTTFVFPDTGLVFTEEDIPAPINFYGVTKWGAEIAAAENPDHAIVRTDQIYGWSLPGQKKSFVVSTLEKLEKGQKAEVCLDWLNSPTYVKDLSAAVKRIMERDKRGIYHVVGGSFIDRVSWAGKIAEAFEKDKSLVAGIESSSLKLPARRPNARVSNDKAQEELGLHLRTVEEGLEDMLGSRP
jgi:dTDP-4-dehydrorhamnose reductase